MVRPPSPGPARMPVLESTLISLMPAGTEVLSVEFKVNLLRPAQGQSFLARAEVIKPGRTLTVARADVFGVADSSDRTLVATMLATIICLQKRPLNSSS